MQLSKDEIQIMKLLISAPDYISSYEIGTSIGMKRRLVREKMKSVKGILKHYGYDLISKTSKGYLIDEKSMDSLNNLHQIISKHELNHEGFIPVTPKERQNYILKRIIEADHYIKIDEIADELLISRSSVSRDIRSAKSFLLKYQLNIEKRPNYGIRIIGSEVNKRKPICDFLFDNLRSSDMYYDFLESTLIPEKSLENGIIHLLSKYRIEMTDIALCDFLIGLSVMMTRVANHNLITQDQDMSFVCLNTELSCAHEIASLIASKIHFEFPIQEINQIAIQLKCKRIGIADDDHIPIIKKITDDSITSIYRQTMLSFPDKSFKKELYLNIKSAVIRLFYNEKLRTPLFNEVPIAYPLAYECAQIVSQHIFGFTDKYVSSSELAFLTMFFHTYMHHKIGNKHEVLLVCSLGYSVGSMYKSQIENKFASQIHITDICSYYQLNHVNLKKYDFIISDLPIHQDLSIPCIKISHVLNEDDYNTISSYLNYLFNKVRIDMLFHDKFYLDNISANKTSAFYFYKIFSQVYTDIKLMEIEHAINQSAKYNYNDEISLFRLSKPISNNNLVSVLIYKEPIPVDNHYARIIILFSCNEKSRLLFDILADLLNAVSVDDTALDSLYQKPSYQKFIRLLIT